MQQLIRITGIKARAEKIGLSLPVLCQRASQPPSTVYRWLAGEHEPRLGHYGRVCEALEAVLGQAEAEVRDHLAKVAA